MPIFEIKHQSDDIDFSRFKIWEDLEKKVLDIDLISDYADMIIIQRNQVDGKNVRVVQRLRACNTTDFVGRGYKVNENMQSKLDRHEFFCFDTDIGDDFIVENLYESNDRKSFSINVATCNDNMYTEEAKLIMNY